MELVATASESVKHQSFAERVSPQKEGTQATFQESVSAQAWAVSAYHPLSVLLGKAGFRALLWNLPILVAK